MDKKELFRAIDACEDRFIRGAAEDIQKRKPSMIRRFFFVNSSENTEENSEKDVRKLSGLRVAAAIVICVVVLSIGVQTAARVSTVFRDWIEQTFQIGSSSGDQQGKENQYINNNGSGKNGNNKKGYNNNTSNIDSYGKNDKKNSAGKEVKNGRSNEEETGRVHRRNNKADEGQDSISQIEKVPMKDNLQIVGTNESFIYESKTDANSDEIVEKVYSIKDGKLSKLPIQSFSGSYKASTFSFQYSIIGQEIFSYNYSKNLVQVFDQINKQGEIYLSAENAKENQLDNCTFLAGDVLTVLDELTEAPDAIVLDPPREGIHPKAIRKILDYGLSSFVYISCKPTSLARDLEVFLEYGYQPVRAKCVDMFPWTRGIETVVLLKRGKR